MTAVRILSDVSADVAEAAKWYDQAGHIGLGDRFEATFYSFVEQLQQRGQIYRPVYSDFRRILLKPFPSIAEIKTLPMAEKLQRLPLHPRTKPARPRGTW